MNDWATATRSKKYELILAAAEESGLSDWRCPAIKNLFVDSPTQEVAALCDRFVAEMDSTPADANAAETDPNDKGPERDAKLKAMFEDALYSSLKAEKLANPMSLEPEARYAAVLKFARTFDKEWRCAAMAQAWPPPKPELAPLCNTDGELNRNTFRVYVEKYLRVPIRFCFETQRLKQPDLKGKITVRWSSKGGRVTSVELLENELTDDFAQCVQRRIAELRFPEKDNRCEYTVTYPFIFGPAG